MTLIPNTRVVFEDITHSYLLDNQFYLMGVTSLMKKHGLSADYADVDEEKLEAARERGSKGHHDIEKFCKGQLKRHNAVTKAFAALNLDVLESEFLVSDNEMIASQIDLILKDYTIIDIKFTSELHIKPLQWQLSIYAYLLEMTYNIKVPKVYALHFDKNNKTALVEIQRLDDSYVEALFRAEKEGYILDQASLIPTANADKAVMELHRVTTYIDGLKQRIKEAEKEKEELQNAFLQKMEETGTKSIVTDFCKITYVASSTRTGIDSKRLKEEMPDIYEEYKTTTTIKPSIRITINKDNV